MVDSSKTRTSHMHVITIHIRTNHNSSCLATKVLISKYPATRRVVVSVSGGKWVGKATAYKFVTCTLIEVHSTMHLVDPINIHVSKVVRATAAQYLGTG